MIWERPIAVYYVNAQTTTTTGFLSDHFVVIDNKLIVTIYVSSATGTPGTITIYVNMDFPNAPSNGWNQWPVASWSTSSAPSGTRIVVDPVEFPYVVTYSCGSCSSSNYYTVHVFLQKP